MMRVGVSDLLIFLYLLVQVGRSDGVAHVVIRLLAFDNDVGTDEHGQLCIGGACNQFLHFCVSESNNGACTSNTKTLRGPWRSNSFSASDMEVNTVAFDIQSYKQSVSLVLSVTHGVGGEQLPVDTFTWSFSELLLVSDLTSQTFNVTGQRNQTKSSATVEVSVSCATNFHPPQCGVGLYCVEGQTCDGHYSCKSNGERACDDGWEGQWCDTPSNTGRFDCDRYRVLSVGLYEGWYTCNNVNSSLGINVTSVTKDAPTGKYQLQAETYHMSETHSLTGEIVPVYANTIILSTPAQGMIRLYSLFGHVYDRTMINGSISTNNRGCGTFSLNRVKVMFNGCHNGGRCNYDPVQGQATCCCPLGWMGDTCQHVDLCYQQSCLNGARCQQENNTRICQCMPGYTGMNCETRIDSRPAVPYQTSYNNSALWVLVEIVSYDNRLGRDYLNTCCVDENQAYRVCHCNHRFYLCLESGQTSGNESCTSGYQLLAGPSYVNSFNRTEMGVKRALFSQNTWTPSLRISIRAVHWRMKRDILVDGFMWQQDQGGLDNDYNSAQWIDIQETGQRTNNPTTLKFRVKTYCGKDFFGPNCSVHCVETDNESGHFSCSNNGSKICHSGWTGDRCEVPLETTTLTSAETTELTDATATDSTTAEGVTVSTTIENVADSTTTENIYDSTTTENVADSTTTEDLADSTTTESVNESTTMEDVTDSTTTETIADTTTTEFIAETTTTESIDDTTSGVTDTISTESVTGSTTSIMPQEHTDKNRSDITCNDDNLEIFIPLDVAGGDSFSFRDPSCRPLSNGSHIIGRVSLTSCGTTVHFINSSIIYRNELIKINGSNMDGVIELECVYPRVKELITRYTPVKKHVVFYERNVGVIDMQMRQYHTSNYSRAYLDLDYPVQVVVDERIYMEITVQPARPDRYLYPALCVATHTQSSSDPVSKILIKNACPVDTSVIAYPKVIAPSGVLTPWRFSFDAFEFSQHAGSTVYVHCRVRMCNAKDSSCSSPSCRNRRGKREADNPEKQDGHFVSGGPFVLSKNGHSASGDIVFPYSFAAISLLVAIVAITIAVIAVRKRPK